jgi:hypothetical protein
MKKGKRIKKLESYLERYTAIADKIFILKSGWGPDLNKLRKEVKRELGK